MTRAERDWHRVQDLVGMRLESLTRREAARVRRAEMAGIVEVVGVQHAYVEWCQNPRARKAQVAGEVVRLWERAESDALAESAKRMLRDVQQGGRNGHLCATDFM